MVNRLTAVCVCVAMGCLSACTSDLDQEEIALTTEEIALTTEEMALTTEEMALTTGGSDAVTGTLAANPLDIACDGATLVEVTFTGSLLSAPVDVMLVLDRSGSMASAMSDLIGGAKGFVDQFDAADGALDGTLTGGSRIGVVSFADGATLDRALTSNAVDVKSAIGGLIADGLTNHEAAIDTAQGELSTSPNRRIMVIFTDGETTAGGDATDDAQDARDAGTEIFAIGLGAFDQAEIESWVSAPVAAHTRFTSDSGELQSLFGELADSLLEPAATGITVSFVLSSHFTAGDAAASEGTALAAGTGVSWSLDELGDETVTLTYVARHDNTQPGGTEPLLASITYADNEGNTVNLPNPSVRVHGCAATLSLTPESAINVVGDTHTVVATVLDDFGDPVSGIDVAFSVTGGVSSVDAEPSAPTPSAGSGATDAAGQVSFKYSNNQAATDQIVATALGQANVATALSDTAEKKWIPIPVVIDIKPGSDPSSIGAKSKGNIPVALFGSATFAVTQIDDSTVRFGDAPSTLGDAADAHGFGHLEQINGDGIVDKVYHFYFPATHLEPGDVEGCLSGELDGLDFQGCSDVNVVPGP